MKRRSPLALCYAGAAAAALTWRCQAVAGSPEVLPEPVLTLGLEEQPEPWTGPFPGRWIEMERVAVDVEDALAAGERYLAGGEASGHDSSPRLHIDLVLSPGELRSAGGAPEHGLVWALSCDAWTASGPQGFLRIENDAETGAVFEVVDHR